MVEPVLSGFATGRLDNLRTAGGAGQGVCLAGQFIHREGQHPLPALRLPAAPPVANHHASGRLRRFGPPKRATGRQLTGQLVEALFTRRVGTFA